jgi:hypothetical protein
MLPVLASTTASTKHQWCHFAEEMPMPQAFLALGGFTPPNLVIQREHARQIRRERAGGAT